MNGVRVCMYCTGREVAVQVWSDTQKVWVTQKMDRESLLELSRLCRNAVARLDKE